METSKGTRTYRRRISRRKPFTAACAARRDNLAATHARHPGAKPVPALAHKLAWLIGPLHRAHPMWSNNAIKAAPARFRTSGPSRHGERFRQTEAPRPSDPNPLQRGARKGTIKAAISPLIKATRKPSQFGAVDQFEVLIAALFPNSIDRRLPTDKSGLLKWRWKISSLHAPTKLPDQVDQKIWVINAGEAGLGGIAFDVVMHCLINVGSEIQTPTSLHATIEHGEY
jgi:hypothetical protein